MKPLLAITLLCAGLSGAAFANEHTAPAAHKGPKPEAMGDKMDDASPHARMMEHMFNKLDANGDGTITKEENTAFAAQKFEENDANKDGKVTKEEWDAAREKRHKEWQEKYGEMKKPDQAKPANTAVPDAVKKP